MLQPDVGRCNCLPALGAGSDRVLPCLQVQFSFQVTEAIALAERQFWMFPALFWEDVTGNAVVEFNYIHGGGHSVRCAFIDAMARPKPVFAKINPDALVIELEATDAPIP